ncbi:hypothetical protein [Devosia sp. CN2-171]|jgi:hypothetical protein|uniref:hypothetical protein n=1 Tax=Devosia sp. CN2-171 TaxID=3400909 RepID=UPI003BF91331
MTVESPASLRDRVLQVLQREIDAILAPAGYVRIGGSWSRTTAFARTEVAIQRSQSGLACYINLARFQRLFGREWVPPGSVYSGWRVGHFTDSVAEANGLDALPYAELDGDSPLRRRVTTLLSERVVPFLGRCHGLLGHRQLPPRVAALRKGTA